MGKTTVSYVNFRRDVACQKLLKSANVSRSYSKNNTGTVCLRPGVENTQILSCLFDMLCLGDQGIDGEQH